MIRTLGLGAPPFLTNHFAQGQPEILLGRWVMRVIFLIVPCCSHHSHKWLCASPIYPHKIRFIFLILVGLYSLFLHYQESVCSKFLLFLPKHPDCETKWKRGKGKNFQKKTHQYSHIRCHIHLSHTKKKSPALRGFPGEQLLYVGERVREIPSTGRGSRRGSRRWNDPLDPLDP